VRVVLAAAVAVVSVVWIAATPSPTSLNVASLVLAILILIGFPLLGTRVYSGEKRLLRERFEETIAGARTESGQVHRVDAQK